MFVSHKKGFKGITHICNKCARNSGFTPKYPADSGGESLFCERCGHYGIGSMMYCVVGDWLVVTPLKYAGSSDVSNDICEQ